MSVFRFEGAAFQKSYQAPSFENIDWQWEEGQQWAIIGPSGAGKTTFAEAVAGKTFVRKGNSFSRFSGSEVYYMSFEEDSHQFHYHDYYYQQRFQSSEADAGITVEQYLGETENRDEIKQFIDIESLKKLSLIKLSNGQTRKIRLVKAFLTEPKLMVLDKPFTGLDKASRKELGRLLDFLCQKGVHLLLIDELSYLPSCITHLLALDECQLTYRGLLNDYQIVSKKILSREYAPLLKLLTKNEHYATFLKCKNLCIKYGDKEILKSINWEVKQGDRWLLKGHNGAGKTTLLSVVYADVPQAYGQDIVQFDRPRGSGESIWDIKQKIGYYSPELQYYFKHDLSLWDVVSTGLTDRLYPQRTATEKEQAVIRSHLEFVGLLDQKDKPFQMLGKSGQNVVLLLRALIKNPPLLMLDEPFLSLNETDKLVGKRLLSNYLLQPTTTLIFISHNDEEVSGMIDKVLELEDGSLKIIE